MTADLKGGRQTSIDAALNSSLSCKHNDCYCYKAMSVSGLHVL